MRWPCNSACVAARKLIGMRTALAIRTKIGRRAAENADEDTAHGVGAAKTAGGGDLIDGVGTLLETCGRALDAKALDESRRRRAGLPPTDACDVARAHGAAIGERGNREAVAHSVHHSTPTIAP